MINQTLQRIPSKIKNAGKALEMVLLATVLKKTQK
jgi:hypothetical protein